MPNAPAACSMFQHVCRIWSSDWRPGERGKATSEQRLGAAVCHGVRTRSAAQRQKHRDSRKPNARQSESDSSSEDEAELETFLKRCKSHGKKRLRRPESCQARSCQKARGSSFPARPGRTASARRKSPTPSRSC